MPRNTQSTDVRSPVKRDARAILDAEVTAKKARRLQSSLNSWMKTIGGRYAADHIGQVLNTLETGYEYSPDKNQVTDSEAVRQAAREAIAATYIPRQKIERQDSHSLVHDAIGRATRENYRPN